MDRLKEAGTVIEFDKMSLDEFLIHLFIREADSQMAKIALEILERDKPNIHIYFICKSHIVTILLLHNTVTTAQAYHCAWVQIIPWWANFGSFRYQQLE